MNPHEHRLYQYLSEPVRLMGLTADELLVGVSGFSLFMFVPDLWVKGFLGLGTFFGVWGMKRVKKMIQGFSLTAYVHWHLGVLRKRPLGCPPSWARSLGA